MTPKDLIITRAGEQGPRFLFVEPYLTSSHEALIQGLLAHIPARWTVLALPGRHFRWRMRGAASFLAQAAGDILAQPREAVLCSSMLDLPALKGLAPALARTPALVYFHENQLAYPAQGKADWIQKERDLYLAFCNLASAQAARRVLFNSRYQAGEFFRAAKAFLPRLPDARPPGLLEALKGKSGVLAVPLQTEEARGLRRERREGPLRLVWNHRWEQDKAPDVFLTALFELARQGLDFRVAVLGPPGGAGPKIFREAKAVLGERLVRLGGHTRRREYWKRLFWADLALSTALQENQGLALAEAVWAGCRPLVPDALAYPEFYPGEFRYAQGRLVQELARLIKNPALARSGGHKSLVQGLTWESLASAWQKELAELPDGP